MIFHVAGSMFSSPPSHCFNNVPAGSHTIWLSLLSNNEQRGDFKETAGMYLEL